ncbi:MAG: tetratricopeptide repeat protein [Planctomycetes bacterium]|nr:tetratricopeptide repeat protein [Planctomycetota bacterium]
MTSKILAATLFALTAVGAVAAQSDKIHLVNGTVVDKCKVTDYGIRSVRYKRGSGTESVETDRVAKIELGEFKSTYARGLDDAALLLTLAREQVAAKNDVMAQLGLVAAANRFLDEGNPAQAVAALNELAKAYPEGGALPEVYRLKFEYYMGAGSPDALKVAKKYETDAIGGAWPDAFAIEASFFQALSEKSSPADFQKALKGVINRARSASPIVASRANIELAHSMRKTGAADDAKRIYEDIVQKENVDDSARAGAYLGLGLIALEGGGGKDAAKEALLNFLRVRLETRDAWPSLHAEALYHASQAAMKWQGPEYRYIVGRCRGVLFAEFPNSEWAKLAKSR